MNFKKILSSSFVLGALLLGAGSVKAVKLLNTLITDQGISDAWEVQQKSSSRLGAYYEVTAFPIAAGKTRLNYGPSRDQSQPFDSLVLSRFGNGLGGILEGSDGWIKNGLSTHFFVTRENVVVNWINPSTEKGQMAARKWNGRSVEALVQTDAEQNVSSRQMTTLKNIKDYVNGLEDANISLKYLGDHSEAQGSKKEGKITNIDAVRTALNLGKLPQ